MRVPRFVVTSAAAVFIIGSLATRPIFATAGLTATADEKWAMLEHERAAIVATASEPYGRPGIRDPYPRTTPAAVQTGIGAYRFGLFPARQYRMTTVASLVPSNRAHYQVYAGALYDSPQQGVLVVFVDSDPTTGHSISKVYRSPAKEGALVLSSIQGDGLEFRTASGSTGHFNAVTGQFS